MKNCVTFQYTKFVNMNRELEEGTSVSYGYRIYKGDMCTYNNCAPTPRSFFKQIPDEVSSVIELIKTKHSDFWEIIKEDGAFMYCNRRVLIDGDKYKFCI